MARETKTIQLYPDDELINKSIRLNEAFGWELLSNQRCQEYSGQDNEGALHYSSFNKLTFSREKSSVWYKEVAELERKYAQIQAELDQIDRCKPKEPTFNIGLTVFLYILEVIPGVIYTIFKCISKSRYKKIKYPEFISKYGERIEALLEEQNEIIQKSDALVNS